MRDACIGKHRGALYLRQNFSPITVWANTFKILKIKYNKSPTLVDTHKKTSKNNKFLMNLLLL